MDTSNLIGRSADLQALAARKNLPTWFLEDLGIQDMHRGGIIIPYFRERVGPARNRIRMSIDGPDRFVWAGSDERPARGPKGELVWTPDRKLVNEPVPIVPYGEWRLMGVRTAGYAIIGEGESDGWACWWHGLPYLGVPGATMAVCLAAEHFAGISRVYLHQEPGRAGEQFIADVAARLRQIGYTGQVLIFSLMKACGCKDPADLQVADSDGFRANMQAAMDAARPAVVPAPDPPRPIPCCPHESLDLAGVDLGTLVSHDCPRSGGRWFCPFCPDPKHANLSIKASKRDGRERFHCFACGEHGDAIDWLIKRRGMDFRQACRSLGINPAGQARRECPEPSEIPRNPTQSVRDKLELLWCPNAVNVVLRGRANPADVKIASVPCKRLCCCYCRPRWNKRWIGHITDILSGREGLQCLPTTAARWETVRKRLQRAEANYFAVKRPDGEIILICDRPIKEADPIASQAAINLLSACILGVEQGTNRPVTCSEAWRPPDPAASRPPAGSGNGQQQMAAQRRYRLLCRTWAQPWKIVKHCRQRGIQVQMGRWDIHDIDYLSMHLPNMSDAEIVKMVNEWDAIKVRLTGGQVRLPVPMSPAETQLTLPI